MNEIYEVIEKSNTILLLSHENPDGDAIGSLMAFYYMLKNKEKDVDFIIDDIPENYKFLKDIDDGLSESNKNYDLAIVLDCTNIKRIGANNDEISRCKKVAVVDHHAANSGYGDYNLVNPTISSCCQVIYYLFKEWNIEITREIGEALTTGMLTDTIGFRTDNVDKETFLMAAQLVDSGVDLHRIYYLVLSKKTMAQYLLMKMTLDRLEMYCDGKLAFSYISFEDMSNAGYKLGDHEGLVDIGRNIGGVEVSVFMREWKGVYNVSLRSNGLIDVNKIAVMFGGGGHKMAAGIKAEGDFKEIKDALIEAISKELSLL